MLIKKAVTLYYPIKFGTIENYVSKTFAGKDLQKLSELTNSYCRNVERFSAYFLFEEDLRVGGVVKKFTSKPFCKVDYKVQSGREEDVLNQIVNVVNSMEIVGQPIWDDKVYYRGVEEIFATSHPEIEDKEYFFNPERISLSNVIVPQYCDKVKFYNEEFFKMRIHYAGKLREVTLYSEPIDPRTIYVGKVVKNFANQKEVETRNNNLCYVSEQDIVIDPKDINGYGLIKNM